ncbi:MAG: hypothetical protein JRH20_04995 [Deltaproteobacteria bacterium]|nr:hypothetical protein [Deltaproteobacteria bacterium]
MPRHIATTTLSTLTAVGLCLLSAQVSGQPQQIQVPGAGRMTPARTTASKRVQRQRVKPHKHSKNRTSWASPEKLKLLSSMNPASVKFQKAISIESLPVRLEVMHELAKKASLPASLTFSRRFRGMQQIGKRRMGPESLLEIVSAGGMGDRAAALIAEGKVKVYDKGANIKGIAMKDATQKLSPQAKVWIDVGGKTYALKRGNVAQPKKTLFSVTPENFQLFKQVMGPNTAWFAVNSHPDHLHALIMDQGRRGIGHHNTFGTKLNDAAITGNFVQYAFPVVFTDQQMDRFVRYVNAGVRAENSPSQHKQDVFGFFAGKKRITGIECTNWATTAPIGDLPRWVHRLDKRLVKLARKGEIKVPTLVGTKGMHAALAAAKDSAGRAAIVEQVLSNSALRGWARRAAKSLAKHFKKTLEGNLPTAETAARTLADAKTALEAVSEEGRNYPEKKPVIMALRALEKFDLALSTKGAATEGVGAPHSALKAALKAVVKGFKGKEAADQRAAAEAVQKALRATEGWFAPMNLLPADLVLRKSLAGMLGIGRSQDPAKWAYDLLMSKQAPVMALLNNPAKVNSNQQAVDGKMDLSLEIMGNLTPDGLTRNPFAEAIHPNGGAIGQIPAHRQPVGAR